MIALAYTVTLHTKGAWMATPTATLTPPQGAMTGTMYLAGCDAIDRLHERR